MQRGIKIINDIINEMGDEFNELVDDFLAKMYLEKIENEYVFDRRYKHLVEIIASNNFENYKDELETDDDSSNLLIKDIDENHFYMRCALQYGKTPNLVKAHLLTFLMFLHHNENKEITPLEQLKLIVEDKPYKKRRTLKSLMNYHIKRSQFKDEVEIKEKFITTMAIVTGKTFNEMTELIIDLYVNENL